MHKWYLLGLSLLLMAQPVPVQAQEVLRPPILVVPTQAQEKPVQLRKVVVNSELVGGFAHTELEFTFYNPNRRVLEGSLEFPLLEGQTVTGFALDIEGKWRDAVAVEKPRAQQVFEDVTRQQVDPALLQVTRGNNYKIRVYPLPAQGVRKVRLQLSERLENRGGTGIYRLPLAFENLPSLKVTLNVQQPDAQVEGFDGLGDLQVKQQNQSQQVLVDRVDYTGSGVLEVALPLNQQPQTFVQSWQGQRYFMAVVPRPRQVAPRKVPQVVEVLWDSSLSGLKRDHQKEFDLLDAYFQKFQNLQVRLIRFRNTEEAAEVFEVQGGNWSSLRKSLEETVYDGGTRYSFLDCEASQGCPPADERLLFSDGLDPMTAEVLPPSRVPLHVISSSLNSDPVRLKGLASSSGGVSLGLQRMTAEQAETLLLQGESVLSNLRSSGAKELVVQEDPSSWTITGILTGTRTPLTFAVNGVPQQLDLSAAAPRSTQVAWLWASSKLASLQQEARFNEAAIRRLGKQFNLVTPETSLLVLDTVEDYVRFEIEPPAELQAAYQQLMQQKSIQDRQNNQQHMWQVLAGLEAYVAWWNRDFPKGDRPTPPQPKPTGGPVLPSPSGSSAPLQVEPLSRAAENEAMDMADSAGDVLFSMADMDAAPPESPSTPSANSSIAIQLQKWTPDAPYIRRMQTAKNEELYRIYLDERPSYQQSTAFYLDVADQLFQRGLTDLALRVLSNLQELELENRALLRILAYRYLQAGVPELALPVLHQVEKLAPYEPQTFRDLGLAYAQAGKPQQAIEQLYEVVRRKWDDRFPGVEQIALNELNAIVHSAPAKLDTRFMDPQLIRNLPLDVRVVLTWDSDNSDMDLWVTDPNQERVYYGHPLSYQGGRISRDMTGGYGPEEFSLKVAKPGKYRIQVNYYGNRQQLLAGDVTLQAKLITHFGTARQKEELLTLRLKDRSETVLVGEFEVK